MTEGGGECQEAQQSDEEKSEQGKMTGGSSRVRAAWLVGAYGLCSEFHRSSVGLVFPINHSRPWQPPTAAS